MTESEWRPIATAPKDGVEMSIDIEKLAREAGIETECWDIGPESVLFISFVDGIPRSNFEDFCNALQCDLLEKAALACESMNSYDEYDPMGSCAAAIRAMKPKAES